MINLVDMVTGKRVEISDAKEYTSPLIWEIDRRMAEYRRLKPTAASRAKLFNRAVDIAILFTGIMSVISMLPLLVYVVTKEHEAICLAFLRIAGVMMVTGFTITVILMLARLIWKRKLEKLGITIPSEFIDN